jgi:hypothetical protein
MALAFSALQELVKAEKLNFWVHPTDTQLMLGSGGYFGAYQFLISLFDDGRFLQIRAVNYLRCPATDAHLPAVLKVLASLNYQYRVIKFGWDPGDGEITAYADYYAMDGTLTQAQLHQLLSCFLPGIDFNYPRIQKTLATGEDPGEADVEAIMKQITSQPSGPAPEGPGGIEEL